MFIPACQRADAHFLLISHIREWRGTLYYMKAFIAVDGRVIMVDGTYQALVEGQAILVENQATN
jgi:hypothetical protein